MPITDYFTDEKVSIIIDRDNNTTFDPATGKIAAGDSTIATVNGIFYMGGQVERLLAEKIRPEATAVAIFDPGADVEIKDKLTINSVKYNVIYVDDIALQGEAVVAALQEIA